MENTIYEAALQYNELMKYQYYYILGRKNKEYHISLRFEKSEFHHLAGLQYLDDLYDIRIREREGLFDNIVKNNITEEYLSSSKYYSKITERAKDLDMLKEYLEGNEEIFKFNPANKGFSKIECKFITKFPSEEKNTYLFLEEREDGSYFGRSLFSKGKDEKDPTENHMLLKILYKERENLITGERVVFYRNPVYKQGNKPEK